MRTLLTALLVALLCGLLGGVVYLWIIRPGDAGPPAVDRPAAPLERRAAEAAATRVAESPPPVELGSSTAEFDAFVQALEDFGDLIGSGATGER